VKNGYAWAAIWINVIASTAGNVWLSRAMKKVGDVGELGKQHGLRAVIGRILTAPAFFLGIAAMAVAFYSLLFGLAWANLSLIVPAAASLTFVANAFAARIFLHEHVGRRRLLAALLVGGGVALMAI
jgi:drug/metabolite transporter (DMT)-like permease